MRQNYQTFKSFPFKPPFDVFSKRILSWKTFIASTALGGSQAKSSKLLQCRLTIQVKWIVKIGSLGKMQEVIGAEKGGQGKILERCLAQNTSVSFS